MIQSSYRQDGDWWVTLGHCPIPETVLDPKNLHPLKGKSKLINYVTKNGTLREVNCLDEEDARKVVKSFTVPAGSIYFKRIVRKYKTGYPDKEILWSCGIDGRKSKA